MVTLEQANASIKDLIEGRLTTPEAILSVFDAMVASKADIIAELNKLTKAALKAKVRGHVWSDDKKADLVAKVWDGLVCGLNPASSWSMSLGARETLESIMRRHIATATPESIAAYSAETLQRRADYLAAVKARLEQIKAGAQAGA